MTLIEAIKSHPTASAFRRESRPSGNRDSWSFHPINESTLPDEEGYFVLKALQVLNENEISECYMDLSMPERLPDFAFFVREGTLESCPIHQCLGKVIPAIAIEKFGFYEQYYCPSCPDVGLTVLQSGLSTAKRRGPTAADMAYILRDEGRDDEAIEAFSIVIEEGTDNPYFYEERAQLYDKRSDNEKAFADRRHADTLRTRSKPRW